MLIDWFTVIAQIVNFLVLLLLLRRFLYRPILDAMQARERKVAERLESAAQERIRAEEERERYKALTEELRQRQSENKARPKKTSKPGASKPCMKPARRWTPRHNPGANHWSRKKRLSRQTCASSQCANPTRWPKKPCVTWLIARSKNACWPNSPAAWNRVKLTWKISNPLMG